MRDTNNQKEEITTPKENKTRKRRLTTKNLKQTEDNNLDVTSGATQEVRQRSQRKRKKIIVDDYVT